MALLNEIIQQEPVEAVTLRALAGEPGNLDSLWIDRLIWIEEVFNWQLASNTANDESATLNDFAILDSNGVISIRIVTIAVTTAFLAHVLHKHVMTEMFEFSTQRANLFFCGQSRKQIKNGGHV